MSKASYPVLFSSYELGSMTLPNRMVMAPMTRSRATGNIPNDEMAIYYSSRAAAGLIITEGVSPSPNGLGYARIPGMYSQAQIQGWKKVTDAVHQKGGRIFIQLMHTGRITHPLNLPAGAEVVAPSPIAATNTQMYTDQQGMQPLPMPKELNSADITAVVAEFVHSAKSAIEAGFDGVELHGANGYLLDQFLNTASNKRTDNYGGSPENRNRFVLEVTAAVANAIGKNKVGIRLSPFGAFNEMIPDNTTEQQYTRLAAALKELGILYLHLVDHSSMGAPVVPQSMKDALHTAFGSSFLLSGGYDAARAEADLEDGKGNLVAFGRMFLANPDLVKRISLDTELNVPDQNTFYTPGEKGYNDYPTLSAQLQES